MWSKFSVSVFMEVHKDFKELLELFNAHGVEYLVVGGYALAAHGAPRNTGDIDLWINPTHANAGRVLRSLEQFGIGGIDLSTEDFVKPDNVVQLGVPPVRVDLVTAIDGVGWDEAWPGRLAGEYGTVPTNFIGRREFLINKRASGRLKDLADVEALGEKV
jgi:hypothetical protein